MPDAPVSQSVIITVSPLPSKVRSLTSAAWSGITIKVKSAISVGFFMPPLSHNQKIKTSLLSASIMRQRPF